MPDQSPKIDSMKRQLATAISASIANKGQSQRAAAALCGVPQPRISLLVSGKVDLFSLDAMVRIADALGCHITLEVIEVEKPQSAAAAFILPKTMTVDPDGFRER